MIKSRLRDRREKLTITVKEKTLANGQHTASDFLTGLTATREQDFASEQYTVAGALVPVTDIFWFEALAGASLPAIEEKHVLVDGSSIRYEVLQVTAMGGEQDRLRVVTKRLR